MLHYSIRTRDADFSDSYFPSVTFTQSGERGEEAVEYTDFTYAEGQDPLNEYPGYDTKESNGEILVMLEL